MSNLGNLTGWDKVELQWVTSSAIHLLIKYHDDMEKVADRFCSGDIDQAFEDIFEKGLQEMLDMCDLDDKLVETETQLQQPKNGLVTSFNKGFFGGE